jgi:uncharacterized protein (DUF2252 family)
MPPGPRTLPALQLDPVALARRQLELDRAATARLPPLAVRKRARQLASPHALFRGSAPLFYELLAAQPALAQGPAGEGFIVGDMHLENAGAYRTDRDAVVFDLNDFDDATLGPWRLDALRLATSVILAGRSFQASASEALDLAGLTLESHARAAFARAGLRAPPVPGPVARMLARAEARTAEGLLDARTVRRRDVRRFQYGERYLPLPASLARRLPFALRGFVDALGDRAPKRAAHWTIADAAQRVAGTGSLGRTRVAVLLHEDDGHERLVEFKQALPSAAERVVAPSRGSQAARVVTAARELVRAPPRLLAHFDLERPALSLVGRRLCPQEDKLDLAKLRPGPELQGVVRTIGHVLGAAHARAARRRPPSPWKERELQGLLDRAALLAGAFEAIHLAYARLDA